MLEDERFTSSGPVRIIKQSPAPPQKLGRNWTAGIEAVRHQPQPAVRKLPPKRRGGRRGPNFSVAPRSAPKVGY